MKYKIGDYVRLTKLKTCETPETKSGDSDTYVYGSAYNGTSLPVDYWLEGYFITLPVVGQRVEIDRYNRNGVKLRGHFESTPVVSVEADGFTTLNSVYKISHAEIQN